MRLTITTLLLATVAALAASTAVAQPAGSSDASVNPITPGQDLADNASALPPTVVSTTADGSETNRAIVGYYPDWVTRFMQPEQIPYEKLTHINYAFALLTQNYEIKFDTEWLMPRVVSQAHAKGTKVLISVGGWTGSRFFTPMVASAATRATFINNAVNFVNQFKLDGLDIDWEYPGRLGMSCNTFDAQHDTDNFLLLLRELRARFDREWGGASSAGRKLITLAVRVEPFDGPSGPISNAAPFAPLVDFVNVMAYDVYGSWSPTTGPNAPFNAGGDSNWSFTQAADSWIRAGFPRSKIVMGTAFYGRSAITNAPMTTNNMFAPKQSAIPRGDQDDGLWGEPCPGAPYTYSSVWQWRNLRSQGALVSPNQAGAGWVRHWDQQTQTPWLFRAADNTFVSYDDPQSLNIKTNYVRKQNLGGVMLWDLHHDNGELLDVLQQVRY
ncbi:glycoside hydrolase superfamily [Dimargaris cristalligena]|uniref:Glycoside hydrolase superfamily n=1 Tax=Dimargaris cristalligena TaxID=215637 RepID=A0A4Q0A295_9FUNG|nr:glycoside hydrolase superfamily [Dimargaris cristalligena]|eukprot:RKP39621.1 glycoside hydrolase superfamily [Dimargaris cristalligena]